MFIDPDILRTTEPPSDKTRRLWWDMAKQREDWYLLIVQDAISGLEWAVFVEKFDSLNYHYARTHRQNDQWVIAIYETWGD